MRVTEPRPAASAWLVDDGDAPLPGQSRRAEVLARARGVVEAAVDGAVAPAGWRAAGCPYLGALFDRLGTLPVDALERLLRGSAGASTDLDGAIAEIGRRAGVAATGWVAAGTPTAPWSVASLVMPLFPALPAEVPVQRDARPGAGPVQATPRPSGGHAPDGRVRAAVEAATGAPLGHARVRLDATAAGAAGARGYTVGSQVVLDPASYAPGTLAGDLLLAHELAHVAQQSRGGGPTPGAAHEEQADRVAVAALRGRAREGGLLGAPLGLQRCSRDEGSAPAGPTRSEELATLLQGTDAVIAQGTRATLGSLGAAHALHQLYQHEKGVLDTGTGIYTGNRSAQATGGTVPAGVVKSDCTELVYEILGKTFASAGQTATWTKVTGQARANTRARGATAVIGLDLLAALQSEAGWLGVFWAPDPTFAYTKTGTTTRDTEHEYAYTVARSAGGPKSRQGYYYKEPQQPGVRIDRLAVKYAPEPGSKTTKDSAALDGLRALPFGVLAARGGKHMALLVRGKVVEIHWDQDSSSVTTIEGTPIESWAWKSGAIVAPAADVRAAFP